jgi:Tat protein secretion system quality control protein TatD with DNase activity
MENMGGGKQVSVWQKVNGGMRSVVLNRSVLRRDFLAGVLLYAGEGTKSLQSARVELANSNPSILRLHVKFMEALGFPIGKLKARFQIHSPEEALEAKNLWMGELGLKASQFVKPMMRASTGKTRRRTFTLQLTYANMMLLHLLRHWTDTLEDLIRSMNL